QPAAAQDMLAHLIDYLRATLSASRVGSMALKDDMAHVQDYLALMQVRMGDRLKVRMDMAPEVRDVPLPPMLVQPLIENAIKHGLDPLPEGGELHIRAFRENDLLTLQVRDTGRGWASASDAPPHPGHGFGLSCIRERLMASYGGAASLHVASAPASGEPASRGTTVTLRLPLRHPLVPIPSC
ncbi:MAG: histidine kinase, partial [Aquabacterium sp.]|uniref:sensor histidine kinase n=1 Tax=Aquabacterium sp. TaxID=1872578 RepID=UPI001B43E710